MLRWLPQNLRRQSKVFQAAQTRGMFPCPIGVRRPALYESGPSPRLAEKALEGSTSGGINHVSVSMQSPQIEKSTLGKEPKRNNRRARPPFAEYGFGPHQRKCATTHPLRSRISFACLVVGHLPGMLNRQNCAQLTRRYWMPWESQRLSVHSIL